MQPEAGHTLNVNWIEKCMFGSHSRANTCTNLTETCITACFSASRQLLVPINDRFVRETQSREETGGGGVGVCMAFVWRVHNVCNVWRVRWIARAGKYEPHGELHFFFIKKEPVVASNDVSSNPFLSAENAQGVCADWSALLLAAEGEARSSGSQSLNLGDI